MNLSLVIVIATAVYILDVLVLVWISVRFVGLDTVPKRDMLALATAIILLSWLAGTALYHVPMVLKPFILLLGLGLIVSFFVSILEAQAIKALAAGVFYLLCQAVLFLTLVRQLWSENFLQMLRYLLFHSN